MLFSHTMASVSQDCTATVIPDDPIQANAKTGSSDVSVASSEPEDGHEAGSSSSAPPVFDPVRNSWVTCDASGKAVQFDNDKQEWVALTKQEGAMLFDTQKNSWYVMRAHVRYEYNATVKDWLPVKTKSKKEVVGSESEDSDSEKDEKEEEEDEFAYQLAMEQAEANKNKTEKAQSSMEEAKRRKDDDGTEYDWDEKRSCWIPVVSEDFLANYQAAYGNYVPPPEEEKPKSQQPEGDPLPDDPKEAKKELRRRKREAEKNATWFEIDEQHNKSVYVSNLPSDITEEQFEEFMSKCGLIDRDLQTKKLKLKLYKTQEGDPKGDGICTFIKVESVELALQILDGSDLRGKIVTVERAKFEMKGEKFDNSKRRKMTSKLKKQQRANRERLLDWRPEKQRGERSKADCSIVVKGLFRPEEFLANASLLFDINELLQRECEKYGAVRKIMVYDNNPEGVATVSFAEATAADDCLSMMDYRVMRGRQVRAERWDGKTKYMVEETEEQKQKRIEEWERSLENE